MSLSDVSKKKLGIRNDYLDSNSSANHFKGIILNILLDITWFFSLKNRNYIYLSLLGRLNEIICYKTPSTIVVHVAK